MTDKHPQESNPVAKSTQSEILELPPDKEIDFHPATSDYPILPEHLKEITESIRRDGQVHPGVAYRDEAGKVWLVSGRTRRKACRALGISFRYQVTSDLGGKTPAEWVLAEFRSSEKVRQLNDSQRALTAARLCRRIYAPLAEKRMKAGGTNDSAKTGKAHELAAKALNLKPNRVRQALKVLGTPELEAAVLAGEVVISAAAKIADLADKDLRKEALDAAKRKDKAALTSLLNGSPRDPLSQSVAKRLEPVFVAARAFSKQARSLRAVSTWVGETAKMPAGMLLCEAVNVENLLSVAHAIEESMPWCQCPFCEGDGGECAACDKRGWLTEKEHKLQIAAALSERRKRVARQTKPAT